MILSFADNETEKIWHGDMSLKLPNEIQQVARRTLRMLHNSHSVNDMRIPPSNQLKKLKGSWKSYYSIRINRQWRIIFEWDRGHSKNVQIIDYHD